MNTKEYTFVITFEPVALTNGEEICFKSKSTKELIRCRDSSHYMAKFCWCSYLPRYMREDDFCSCAEKKEGK